MTKKMPNSPGKAQSWYQSQRKVKLIQKVLTYILLGAGGLLFLIPLFWQFSTSLKTSAETVQYPPVWLPLIPQWQNYPALMEKFPFVLYAGNSIIISILVILGTVLSNSLAAYGFARLRMPGRDFIFLALLSTLMLPSTVLIIPQFVIFQSLHWTNTYNPLVIPAFFGNAFYLFLLRQFFMGIPRDLEDAARIDGAGYFRVYSQIMLPMARPAMIIVALFTFVATWNDFFGPLIYLSDKNMYTVAVALRYLQGSVRSRPENHLLMAAATLSILPCLIIFFVAQRQFIQGTVITGVKG